MSLIGAVDLGGTHIRYGLFTADEQGNLYLERAVTGKTEADGNSTEGRNVNAGLRGKESGQQTADSGIISGHPQEEAGMTACREQGTVYVWECENGHRFEASLEYVLLGGGWCTECPLDEVRKCTTDRNRFISQVLRVQSLG